MHVQVRESRKDLCCDIMVQSVIRHGSGLHNNKVCRLEHSSEVPPQKDKNQESELDSLSTTVVEVTIL